MVPNEECPVADHCTDCPQPLSHFYQVEQVHDLAVQIAADSPRHLINAVAEWIRDNIPYVVDPAGFGREDWWQYPLEVLDKGAGDCEDSSYLCASLLESLGYQTQVCIGFVVSQAHAWVEVRDPRGCWFLIETTLGEVYRLDNRHALGYHAVWAVTADGVCEKVG